MNLLLAVSQTMKFFLPSLFSLLFRINGLGIKSRKSTLLGMTLFVLLGFVLPLFVILVYGYEIFKTFSLPILLTANAVIFLFSSDSFLKTSYLHLSQVNVVFWIGTAMGAIRRIFQIPYPIHAVCLLGVCAAFYTLAIRRAAQPLRFMADNIHSGWLTLLATPLCTLISGMGIAIYLGTEPHNRPVLILLFTTFVELGFVLHLIGLYRAMRQIADLERERGRQELLEAELSSYDDYLAAARQSRHDLRHHNAVLLEYLKSGCTQQAMEYLSAANNEPLPCSFGEFCKNPTANAILRIYARKAQAAGISFSAQVEIPEQLPLNAPELGALVSNLLENAIEACIKLTSQRRVVSLSARSVSNGWRLELCNSAAGTVLFENGLPRSTKAMGGTGTRSVAHIVETHHGLLRFIQEHELFIVQILLPLENETTGQDLRF